MPSGEERADKLVKAIGACMERSNLNEAEQIEVLTFLLNRLAAVKKQFEAVHGPTDDELLDDKEAEDDE